MRNEKKVYASVDMDGMLMRGGNKWNGILTRKVTVTCGGILYRCRRWEGANELQHQDRWWMVLVFVSRCCRWGGRGDPGS